ncbi:MAG: sugar ABC transporter substrate-binding protein [Phototrophicaceae bacterium]
MNKVFRLGLILSLLLVAVVALPSQAQDCETTYRIVVVTHGQASDPFWSVVSNGVADADAEFDCVVTEYNAPETFDMVAMSQLIDQAVASAPDGLIVSNPDPSSLEESISAAIAAGIPVISINSGSDVAADLGVVAHIGQTEYEAGFGGGQRMAAAGVTNAICVNQEVGNIALDLRCGGFADAMAETGGTVSVLEVDLNDPTDTQNRVLAALGADESINGVFTLGPSAAVPVLEAMREEGLIGVVALATFDLSPEVLGAISSGEVLFAIDQQQYTQGYLAIVYMYLHVSNLNTPGSIVVQTGPGFVTADTADAVIEYSARGTR